ncbi:MAG TPA: hypothetical protein VF773_22115 [Verrucomicrobiae bacterium]
MQTDVTTENVSWFVAAIGEFTNFAGRLVRNFFNVAAIGLVLSIILCTAAFFGITPGPAWRTYSVCSFLGFLSLIVTVAMAGNLAVVLSLSETVREKGLAKKVLDRLFEELLGITDQNPEGTQEQIRDLHGMPIPELRRRLKIAGKGVLKHPIAVSLPNFVRWLAMKAERLLVWATVRVVVAYATRKADEQKRVDLLALRANLTETVDEMVTRRITQNAIRLALLVALGTAAVAWAIVAGAVRIF